MDVECETTDTHCKYFKKLVPFVCLRVCVSMCVTCQLQAHIPEVDTVAMGVFAYDLLNLDKTKTTV